MSLEEKQAAALRRRRRAFLDEVERIKKRQGGITKSQEQILEGVYELEPIPDWRTEARLAMQLGLDSLAVTAWFKARRKKQKRANIRYWYTVIVGVLFVLGLVLYYHELGGLSDMLKKRRLGGPPNKRFFTKSGLPRPYRVKPPGAKRFQAPKDPPKNQKKDAAAGSGGGGSGGKDSAKAKSSSSSSFFGGSATKASTVRYAKPTYEQEAAGRRRNE